MLEFAKDAPEQFMRTPWQQHDLNQLMELDYSANWSSMGTYKTSTLLWLIEEKLQDQSAANVLIVTTKSGKGAYFDALPRCLSLDDWRVFNVGTRTVEEVLLHDLRVPSDWDELIPLLRRKEKKVIVLAHYHCFTNKSPFADILEEGAETEKLEWDFVGLDEAHRIKSKDVQWARRIKRIAKNAKSKHVMTGTGFVNNPAEIWSLLHFLNPYEYLPYWKFRERYCEESMYTGFRKIVGIKEHRIDEFVALRKGLGPRRTMQEVHPDIGEPIYSDIEVELNPTQRRMYKEIVRELRALDQKGVPIHSPNVVSQLQRLRQISVATPELINAYYDAQLDRYVQEVKLVEPSSKLDAVMEVVESLEWDDEQKQQVVVFSNFRDPLELLKKRLEPQFDKNGKKTRDGIPYIHMEQKDSEQTRFEKWREQWPSKQHRVFLTTIALGGESINLASAQYAIFLDRSWSPAQNLQAVGRVYRPGQTGIAEVIYINAKNTVDKKVLENVEQKVGWFKLLFDDEEEK